MSLSVFLFGSRAGSARSIAGITVRSIARHEFVAVAREATTTMLVFIDEATRIDSATLAAIERVKSDGPTIVGGRQRRISGDCYGAMLAAERFGPFSFAIAPLLTAAGERNVDTLFVGPVDVIAEGCFVITRTLAIELGGFDPTLEDDYALADLCVRARALGAEVRCEPSIVFSRASEELPARRPLEAMHALAQRLIDTPLRHDPPGVRKRGISREVRLPGGVRVRVRKPVPPVTLLVWGKTSDARALLDAVRASDAQIARIVWADESAPDRGDVERVNGPLASLRAMMERRGDRYVVVLDAAHRPSPGWLDRLIDDVEWGSDVAIALAERDEPARAAIITLRLVPQHVCIGDAASLADALVGLAAALAPLRRGMRTRAGSASIAMPQPPAPATTSVIFLAGSKPEIVRSSFEALVGQTASAREYLIVFPAGAETTRLLLASYPRVTLVPDGIDPQLAVGLNAALAMATGDRILVASDEYLFAPGTVAALFAAFDRDPALGLAAPRTNGGELPQAVFDVSYVDLVDMQRYASLRLDRFRREMTFIDRITSVAFAIERRVLEAIGGIDERFGVNRFAVEDYALRARAAGYRIAMCDDVFVHRHKVEYSVSSIGHADSDTTLWTSFRRKWSLPSAGIGAYDPTPRVDAGFDPQTQFVPLRESAAAVAEGRLEVAFVGTVEDDASWGIAADALRAYFLAFDVRDPVSFVLGVARDGPQIGEVAARIRRLLAAAEVSIDSSMNVELVAFEDATELLALVRAPRVAVAFGARAEAFASVERVRDRSRAALRAYLEPLGVAP